MNGKSLLFCKLDVTEVSHESVARAVCVSLGEHFLDLLPLTVEYDLREHNSESVAGPFGIGFKRYIYIIEEIRCVLGHPLRLKKERAVYFFTVFFELFSWCALEKILA